MGSANLYSAYAHAPRICRSLPLEPSS